MSDAELPPSVEITRKDAMRLHNQAIAKQDLIIWTIYESPSDYPGQFVVRPTSVRHESPFLNHMLAHDLEAARRLIPPGTVCFERSETDDPVIVETWF
jgi:hypothetical protein